MEVSTTQLLEARRLVEAEQLALEGTRRYLRAAQAENTTRAYRTDWELFEGHCRAHGHTALPANQEVLAVYISGLAIAGRKVSTIERRLAGISVAHQAAGQPSPTTSILVRKTMAGIRRTHGSRKRQADPLMPKDLVAILRSLPDSKSGKRDRALLLLGFTAALRRSEIASLQVGDVVEVEEGLRVTVRESKTDPSRIGREVGIPRRRRLDRCPVEAVRQWTSAVYLDDGPLFRSISRYGRVGDALSSGAVGEIIKRVAARAGITEHDFSGHSLRAGFVTAAAAAGAPERSIMAQTGHRSVQTVRAYIRSGSLFLENAADYIKL
jgi:integrase